MFNKRNPKNSAISSNDDLLLPANMDHSGAVEVIVETPPLLAAPQPQASPAKNAQANAYMKLQGEEVAAELVEVKNSIEKMKLDIKTATNLLKKAEAHLKDAKVLAKRDISQTAKLEQAEKNVKAAKAKVEVETDKIAAALKSVYWLNYVLSLCYLGTDLIFALYQFKMCGESISSFATAWEAPEPSSAVQNGLGGALTTFDTAFNLLTFTAAGEANAAVLEYFEENELKGILESKWDGVVKAMKTAKDNPIDTTTNLGHYLVKRVHNLIGGAADILGINPVLYPYMGDPAWALYVPILYLANGYYGAVLDPKYDAGKESALKQLKSLPVRAIKEGEIARAVNVFTEGVIASAGLRALGFTFIAEQVKQLGWGLSWVSPTAVGAIVFWHTLCSRFDKTYQKSFGKKDELTKKFSELMIADAKEMLVAENTSLLEGINHLKTRIADSRSDEEKISLATALRAKEKSYASNGGDSEEVLNNKVLAHVSGIEFLINENLPASAQLSDEKFQQLAMEKIAEKATLNAATYSAAQKSVIQSKKTWKESIWNAAKNAPIATLRGALGGMINHHYGADKWVSMVNAIGLTSNMVEKVAKYGPTAIIALVCYAIYHRSATQSSIDADIVDLFVKENEYRAAELNAALNTDLREIVVESFPNVASEYLMDEDEAIKSFSDNFTIEGIAKGSAYTITILSAALRLISQVHPMTSPLIGLLDQKILLLTVSLLLTEQQVNAVQVFTPDVEKAITGYLKTLQKCFAKKEAAQGPDLPGKDYEAIEMPEAKDHHVIAINPAVAEQATRTVIPINGPRVSLSIHTLTPNIGAGSNESAELNTPPLQRRAMKMPKTP